MYVRKHERAKFASHDPRYGFAIRKAMSVLEPIRYEDREDGRRVRIWGDDPYVHYVTDEDVRAWLLKLRVVEDLDDGLEFVRAHRLDRAVLRIEGCWPGSASGRASAEDSRKSSKVIG